MKLGKSKIFLLFCLSFIVGVFLGNYLNYYVIAVSAMIFVMLVTLNWKGLLAPDPPKADEASPNFTLRVPSGNKIWVWRSLIGFLGLTLLLGAWRYKTSFPYDEPNFVGKYYGQEMELEGIVVREPDVRSSKINLTVRPLPQSLPSSGEGGFVGNVLLNLGRYPEYQYGDRLKISGKLEEPFVSEEFSYKDYLSRFDTYAVMRFPEAQKIGQGQGGRIKSALLAVKHKFQEILSQALPEPHNALVLGLILGLKRALPESLREALIAVGVSHIIVISGYNISLITRNILKTRWVWGRRAAFILTVSTVLAFVIMTGAEASVIRAAVMGLMLVFAMNIGRIYQARNAVIFAAALMVAQNPKILNFDIGFQLSFVATIGLIYLAPIFEKWFQKIPDFLSLRTNLASTLAAIIFTLPLLIYYFDRLSIAAPLVNVLVLWAVPYTMFLGLLAGAVGLLFLPLAKIVTALAWVLLEYVIRTVEFFARLPFSGTSIGINIPVMIIYYALLVFGLWAYRNRKRFFYEVEYVKQQL